MKNKKYVVLEGLEHGNRFYTTNHENPTKSAKGEIWYKIIGYADSSEEAQSILYPNEGDFETTLRDHIIEMGIHCNTEDIDQIVNLCK